MSQFMKIALTQIMEAIISCPYAGLGHCPEGQGPDTVYKFQ